MKSYFANSFRVAMDQARKELGPDAMLVTTRAAAVEARHLGEYEVVFAADLPLAPETAPVPQKETPKRSTPAPGEFTKPTFPQVSAPQVSAASDPAEDADLNAMLEEMRRQLQFVRRQLKTGRKSHASASSGTDRAPASAVQTYTKELVNELIQREVFPEIAQRLVSAAENRVRAVPAAPERGAGPHVEVPVDRNRLRAALFEEIQDAFQVDSRLMPQLTSAPSVLALIGPPGAGKTATIAKLAVRRGLTARKPAVLISLDTLRVGASEQLRCYASLLGLAFQTVETNRALEQAIEEHRNKELILIDTPGFTLTDLRAGCEAAEFLMRRADIQKHLVLAASMRSADIARMSAAYAVFKPSHSVFTRLDETESFGAILNESIVSGRPIAFFSAGQRVPEDLTDATNRELATLLLPSSEPSSSQLAGRPVDTMQTAA
jgi:flagellar biosynthesis protein FlhF